MFFLPTNFTVSLSKVMKELGLSVLFMPEDPEKIMICSMDVNRPGLELNRFYDYFDTTRILIFGNAETAFLNSLSTEERREVLDAVFSKHPPAAIIARDLKPTPEMLEAVQANSVPLLSTADTTSSLVAALVSFMNVELAPRITRHGVLVEVYGEGILLLGDSGVGKSETAIELIKRGHRLIADDAVEIRRVSAKSLVGQAPENIRHFIELRGIGIIDVKTLFGVESVKDTQSVDLVIKLEEWDRDKEYDRLGLHEEYTEYLGNKIVCHSLPIRPGRNLAVIVESAAVNHRQKKMGYNAAEELYKRVQANIARKREE